MKDDFNNISEIDRLIGARPDGKFPVPDGYFEEVQDNVWTKLNLSDGTVTENYFDELPEKILAKARKRQTSVFSISRVMGIAASLLLLVCAGWFVLNGTSTEDQFSEDLAAFYLEKNIDNISLDLISEYVSDEMIAEGEVYEELMVDTYFDAYGTEDLDIELLISE